MIILLIIIGLFGCQKYEYTAYDKKSGVELSNVYQSESDWSANDMGYAYKGTGSISNSNNYDIHIKQTRIYYRNNMLIDTFVIKAKGCKVFYFTGGDIFEMTDRDGTPMGVLHATPKKGNKASRQTRE